MRMSKREIVSRIDGVRDEIEDSESIETRLKEAWVAGLRGEDTGLTDGEFAALVAEYNS